LNSGDEDGMARVLSSSSNRSDLPNRLGAEFTRSNIYPRFASTAFVRKSGKALKNQKQEVKADEKLGPALHRNLLILLGKLPLR
jgi:hypothetical protein